MIAKDKKIAKGVAIESTQTMRLFMDIPDRMKAEDAMRTLNLVCSYLNQLELLALRVTRRGRLEPCKPGNLDPRGGTNP